MILIYNPGFKIRKKDDVDIFVNKVLKGDGSISIKIDRHEIYFITREKDYIYISHKIGDIYDMFNPELVLPDEQLYDAVWKIRKYINQRFFN